MRNLTYILSCLFMPVMLNAQIPKWAESLDTIYTIEEGPKIISKGFLPVSKLLDIVNVNLLGFEKYKAQQKTPTWCWAACIQMVINQRDIQFTQEEVVKGIKGKLDWSSATEFEITNFLTGWKYYDDGRVKLTTGCFYMEGPPIPNMILRQIGPDGRPLIVSIKDNPLDDEEHLVVLYKVRYQVGVGIINVTIFDPLKNKIKILKWSDCLKNISGSFFTSVSNHEKESTF